NAVFPAADTYDGDGPSRDLLLTFRERAHIPHALFADGDNADAGVEFVLEPQWAVIVEPRGHARKPHVAARRDAQSRLSPERMFGLLHVAEVDAEVHDPCGVDFVEHDPAVEGELGKRHPRSRCTGSLHVRAERTA